MFIYFIFTDCVVYVGACLRCAVLNLDNFYMFVICVDGILINCYVFEYCLMRQGKDCWFIV